MFLHQQSLEITTNHIPSWAVLTTDPIRCVTKVYECFNTSSRYWWITVTALPLVSHGVSRNAIDAAAAVFQLV
jgi:hypothetical protein